MGFIKHILISCLLLTSQANCESLVDPTETLVEWEGWGTSLTWWPDVLVRRMDGELQHLVTKAFFGPEGLNLNIVRYTIGGTSPNNHTCGEYRAGGATESYRDGPDKPYDWNRDAGQRKVLIMAKALGVDTFEAFSNSPPQWMTISGCSKGNAVGGIIHSNFDASQAPAFAEYIADVLERFRDHWDIDFQTYAPFNEPFGLKGIGGWLGPTGNQEGCNMNQQTMTDTIKVLYEVFQRRNISTKLSVADETQVDTAVSTQEFFEKQNITHMIDKVNVHGYWDSAVARRDVLHSNAVQDGHRLWMDEMGWGESGIADMTQGLEIANRIVRDLKEMMPSAWVYWQAMEDVGAWGLLAVPYDAAQKSIRYNNGYFAFMQFTKYIRKGYSIIPVNEDNTVAAFHAQSKNLVLVIVNPTKQRQEQEYNLELFSGSFASSATRTSNSELHKTISQEISIEGKLLKYSAPAETITTVVVADVVRGSSRM